MVLNERIQIQRESIQRNERELKGAGALFIQGKGLRGDTLRTYTSVKNLEPELYKLSFESETVRLRLKALIGIDSVNDVVLTDSLTLPDPATLPSESDVYSTALQMNPDLQRLSVLQRMNDQQIRISKAGRMWFRQADFIKYKRKRSIWTMVSPSTPHLPTLEYRLPCLCLRVSAIGQNQAVRDQRRAIFIAPKERTITTPGDGTSDNRGLQRIFD